MFTYPGQIATSKARQHHETEAMAAQIASDAFQQIYNPMVQAFQHIETLVGRIHILQNLNDTLTVEKNELHVAVNQRREYAAYLEGRIDRLETDKAVLQNQVEQLQGVTGRYAHWLGRYQRRVWQLEGRDDMLEMFPAKGGFVEQENPDDWEDVD
jgi:hypothetical protein